MKGTNLNPSIVTRLRENVITPGGLHHFDLSNTNAGSKELSLVADSIKYNFQSQEGVAPLLTVDLSGNNICGVDFLMTGTIDTTGIGDFVTVLTNIGAKSRLKKLNLSKNYFDVRGFSILANLLSSGPSSLTELNVRDCGANDECIVKLCEGMKQNKSLTILDVSHNHFGQDGCEAIAEVLATNTSIKLKHLLISECELGPDACVSMIKGLHSNASLEALVIGDNNIGNVGAEAIAAMLKVNVRLKQLDIQENEISDEGMEAIASALKTNRVLNFLGIQWNPISNTAAGPLSEALSGNNILRAIHILGTNIDGEGIKKIMDNSATIGDKRLELDLGFAYVQ
mmetsp:Transcript_2216/g.3492  ORF Transcript_2216/g.3492 Transcript_2216/m.3492 type:complete len:341 (-) Transcript_2216:196-1218(-)|eukprot:CAMPEP_0174963720 /NCGR_PEP_ID=MMETSP0004_2-20121128/5485_1 /TAXON_ID=420556 /ORGANISM="Ochromonas sp., Strain CCMP1393" /LENGTH=340 /DNA_ID=CAMNT_0016212373 /DNA_START=27 /DNA_END=1049 /DNA_ORIENTATION=-